MKILLKYLKAIVVKFEDNKQNGLLPIFKFEQRYNHSFLQRKPGSKLSSYTSLFSL